MMTMKKIPSSILLFGALFFIFTNCQDGEPVASPCESDGGAPITDRVGRIYRWTQSVPHFYYIGNTQPVATGLPGGYIACHELPKKFQVEGIEVIYSGLNKGPAFCDACDPLFAYIHLTSIEMPE
jgi:hypothetical protein